MHSPVVNLVSLLSSNLSLLLCFSIRHEHVYHKATKYPQMRAIDLFTDKAAILDSIVSDIYYGMLRGQIHTNLPPEHAIITI